MGENDMDHEMRADDAKPDGDAAPMRDSDDDEDRRPARAPRSRSRSRSRERSRSRSPARDKPQRQRRERRPVPEKFSGLPTDVVTLGNEDAAFLLGSGGSTKRKVARVAGCHLELMDHGENPDEHALEITGDDAARARCKEYVEWVLKQRVGAIEMRLDAENPRDDLSIVDVPNDCVAYVMGKNGCVLRSIEEEWGTLMFFGKPLPAETHEREGFEKLMILGSRRGRRGAELKVMSAVEHKTKGFYVGEDKKLRNRLDQVGDGEGDGFGYDVFPFEPDEFSYALGAQGSTRKKLAAASGAIIEYVGPVAIVAGTREERRRGWDYLNWLLKQRRGPLSVSPAGRDDVTEFKVPRRDVGRLQGHKAENLRSIERETNTFCFITDDFKDPDGREEMMLIFGTDKVKRYKALDLMEDAMAGRYRPRGLNDRGGSGGGSRGACFDFQRGRCTRGASCRFSHDDRGGGGGGGGGPDRGGRDRRRDDRPYARSGGRDRSRDRGGDRRGRSRSPRGGRDDRYDRR